MERLFNTKSGKIILSVIWGLGIAALFYKVCQHTGCFLIKEHSPPGQQVYDFKPECADSFSGKCGNVYEENTNEFVDVPQCERPLFNMHPPIAYYEKRQAKNCGDPIHCKNPSCYKFHPMDTIFKSPSQQIVYPYH